MGISVETIFAVASGQPPAAIAVMRISGPRAFDAAIAIAGGVPPVRTASLRPLCDPESGSLLDRALVLAFAGPSTATGEDIVEFHLHGGRAVIAAVAAALSRLADFRPADPGEFTRRALMNGRIDLAEAEGLGDLLMAQTEIQRRVAMASAEGAVSRALGRWSGRLLGISAQVEAALDFSDEDDVDAAPSDTIALALQPLIVEMTTTLAAPAVERLHHGFNVVLAGPPNSGKSTLLNALSQRDAAIVSPIAGTTRDRIEASVVRNGLAYVLTDTAGLADGSEDPIEVIGIERTRQSLATADVVLWFGDERPECGGETIWLWPRADIDGRATSAPKGRLPVSGISGIGLEDLWSSIEQVALRLVPRDDQLALNARQRTLCAECLDELTAVSGERDLLIVAEHLRLARRAIDKLTGATHVEEMLDALFGRFCIGK